jgi:hypothetical protein
MKLTKMVAPSLAVFMLFAGATGQAATCSGVNINNALLFESNELADGTTLSTLRLSSVHVSEDTSSPLHLAAGECSGADRDGDVYNEQWNLAPGAEKGSWKLVGGSGKYAGISGSGWWQVIMSEGKMAAVQWVGTCR